MKKNYPVLTSVAVVGDFTVRVEFNDGVVRDHDMSDIVGGNGVWAPLADPAYFAKVKIDVQGDTIIWPNVADVCPEILHGDVEDSGRQKEYELYKDAEYQRPQGPARKRGSR